MPSYITHAIFGQELYREYLKYNQNRLIDSIYMTQYSLGPDLSRFTNSYYETHEKKTKDLLMSMIYYIKEKKLINDQNVLGILFGHISHYFLDTNMHPLIYYNAEGCQNVGILSSHTLIEGFLDVSFRSNKGTIGKRYLKDIKINEDKYNEIVSYAYDHVYQEKRIISSIKKSLIGLSSLELLVNIIPEEYLIRISRFKDFLEINELSKEEILNNCHSQWRNPVTGDKSIKTCEELYWDAFNQAIEAMKVIDNYFYNITGIGQVEKLFRNLSYNTGVDLNFDQTIRYTRKKIR